MQKVILFQKTMIDKKQQDLLEIYLNEGYDYKDTLDLCDFNVVIVEKEPEAATLQTELQRLHSILTEVTSEKDAFEELLQETQLELEEVKEALSKVVNELNVRNIELETAKNINRIYDIKSTHSSTDNTTSDHPTPAIPSSGIYRTSQGSLDMYEGHKIFRVKYHPEIMQYDVPQEAINSLVNDFCVAIDAYTHHHTVLIGRENGHCIECEVVERDPLMHIIIIKKK